MTNGNELKTYCSVEKVMWVGLPKITDYLKIQAEALLADKAYDAGEPVLQRLEAQQCEPVIPPKSNRQEQRSYDKELDKARHLIENFFFVKSFY
jgi:hypothetical protein